MVGGHGISLHNADEDDKLVLTLADKLGNDTEVGLDALKYTLGVTVKAVKLKVTLTDGTVLEYDVSDQYSYYDR